MFNNLKIICSSVLLILMPGASAAKNPNLTVGATYAIEEPDALEEIKTRAGGIDWRAALDVTQDKWGGLQSPLLPKAKSKLTRTFKPIYRVEFDIKDKDGRIIYPQGFEFNPLEYTQLPARIVVIGRDKRHIEWARKHIIAGDMILTAGGDPRSIGEALQQPVFLFDPRMTARLGVTVVPSIIEQRGTSLHIEEIYVKS